jgi:hypothetical protein
MIPILIHHASDHWVLSHSVTFDGANKLILINKDVTSLNVKVELYSDWKEWIELRDHLKFEASMRSVGGDPTVGSDRLGSSFFLINGWRIRTWEGDHRLVVNGNLFEDTGLDPFVPTLGKHNTTIQLQVSTLVETVTVSGSAGAGFSPGDKENLDTIKSIVLSLPESGSLTSITNNLSTIKGVTALRTFNVTNAAQNNITATPSDPNNTYDNMYAVITSGAFSVSRKIEQYQGGAITFDVDLPFTTDTNSTMVVVPGYNPINGRVG